MVIMLKRKSVEVHYSEINGFYSEWLLFRRFFFITIILKSHYSKFFFIPVVGLSMAYLLTNLVMIKIFHNISFELATLSAPRCRSKTINMLDN